MSDSSPSIIAFAPGTWRWPDVYGSTRYHLWTLAEMGWRVLYVEPPVKVNLFSKTWSAPDRDFHVLSPGRVVPFAVRKVPNQKSGEAWRQRTSKALAARALESAKKLGLSFDVCWFGAPWHSAIHAALPEGFAGVCHVYDELALSPALEQPHRSLLWDWESELVTACHLSLCSSMPQFERRTKTARRCVLLENGVRDEWLDAEHPPRLSAADAAVLERVRAMPRPIMLYTGVVDHRLDMRCFDAALTQNPEGSLVFGGHLDDSRNAAFFEEHDGDERVHSTGRVSPDVLLALCREADVLLIGHRRTPFTDAMLPEKLNEYLATGKPVVSIDLPEVARVAGESELPNAIRLASSPAEFGAEVREACIMDEPELAAERMRLASQRTWRTAAALADAELRALLG